MNQILEYKDYKIFKTSIWNGQISGYSLSLTVYSKTAKAENDYAFIEKFQITNWAIKSEYGDNSHFPESKIVDKFISKAKTRIDLAFFENGKVYSEEVDTKSLNEVKAPLDDDETIQFNILKVFLNIRKSNPSGYVGFQFDPYSFCDILEISFNNYVYNAMILQEDRFIDSLIDSGIQKGMLHITNLGIKKITQELKTQDIRNRQMHTPKVDSGSESYDVAISFAGEDRAIADDLAQKLRNRDVIVFYDAFKESDLWGKNLYEYFNEIFSERSRFCIMLLSKCYEKKLWTNHERRSAQARAFRENREYILPIRLDDTKISGIDDTVGFLDFKNTSVERIVELVLEKLKKEKNNVT